jgi:hypothetical protein
VCRYYTESLAQIQSSGHGRANADRPDYLLDEERAALMATIMLRSVPQRGYSHMPVNLNILGYSEEFTPKANPNAVAPALVRG